MNNGASGIRGIQRYTNISSFLSKDFQFLGRGRNTRNSRRSSFWLLLLLLIETSVPSMPSSPTQSRDSGSYWNRSKTSIQSASYLSRRGTYWGPIRTSKSLTRKTGKHGRCTRQLREDGGSSTLEGLGKWSFPRRKDRSNVQGTTICSTPLSLRRAQSGLCGK